MKLHMYIAQMMLKEGYEWYLCNVMLNEIKQVRCELWHCIISVVIIQYIFILLFVWGWFYTPCVFHMGFNFQ